ncbi:hypothetical protein TNCV_2472701 [Trichonephila clavipes]|nr:hypothetical protein TNCV_2472701 [Trichonephila clavipes]
MAPPTSCFKEDSSRRFTSVQDGPNRCLPRAHFNDRGARGAARETRRIGICRSAGTSPCSRHLPGIQHETSFCHVLQKQLVPKKTLVDNFKRALMEAKHVNEFRPDDIVWEKFSKGLLRYPVRPLKNTDKRMVYIYNNMFFVKKHFTFGLLTVKSGAIHLIQTTNVRMLIYEFPSSNLRCRVNPNFLWRSFEPYDHMLYHRMVLEPHTVYPNPDGTRYIWLTVQNTVFETNKQPLEEQPGPSSKRNRVFITPVIRPPVPPMLIARSSTAFSTLKPVSILEPPVLTTPQILLPDPPVQIPDPPEPTTPPVQFPDPPVQIPVFQPPVPTTPPVQLFLPDPPPVQIILPSVVETLEPTLTDDSTIDQIMSSVFGDC